MATAITTIEQAIRYMDGKGWLLCALSNERRNNAWTCIFERRKPDASGKVIFASATEQSALGACTIAIARAENDPKHREGADLPSTDKLGQVLQANILARGGTRAT